MIPAYPHRPGSIIKRYSPAKDYRPAQWARWLAVDDAYYAFVNGYADTRHPDPRAILDKERYKVWQETITAAWDYESKRQHGSAGMKAEDMPEGLQQYLYQRLLDAERLVSHAG